MENASKALIIAGAILIAILLISLGVIMFNASKGTTQQASNAVNAIEQGTEKGVDSVKDSLKDSLIVIGNSEKDIFNSQFISYEGTRTGTEVNKLISIVRASNAKDNKHKIFVTSRTESQIIDSNTYKVQMHYSDGSNGILFNTLFGYVLEGSGTSLSEKGYIEEIYISK